MLSGVAGTFRANGTTGSSACPPRVQAAQHPVECTSQKNQGYGFPFPSRRAPVATASAMARQSVADSERKPE